MPQTSLKDRIRRARKEGTDAAVKATDRGGAPRSKHRAKKSSQIVARRSPTQRSGARKRQPGAGRTRTATRTRQDTVSGAMRKKGHTPRKGDLKRHS